MNDCDQLQRDQTGDTSNAYHLICNVFNIVNMFLRYFCTLEITRIVACENWGGGARDAVYSDPCPFSYVRYHRKSYGHEEETVIPKHTIHSFGQAGMSRRNRSSFAERTGGRQGGETRGVEQAQRERGGGGGERGVREKQRSFALGAENLTQLTLLPNQTFRQL